MESFKIPDRLCVMTLESKTCGVFNVGSGEGHSINEIVALVRGIVDQEVQIELRKGRLFDVQEIVLDNSRACTQFDWKPEISLADGIEAVEGGCKVALITGSVAGCLHIERGERYAS